MVSQVIAFDIYGTIINLDGMVPHLETVFGARAQEASQLWREKQVEYSFRRALMRTYVDFDICTAQALTYISLRMGVSLKDEEKRKLLHAYLRLPVFPDVNEALKSLENAGHTLVALTNGTENSVRSLLDRCALTSHLKAIISVETIETFKPNPAVYRHLVRRVRKPKKKVWLVSSNPWDVIGAKAYGLKCVWLRRSPAHIFDSWEFSPDIVITALGELCHELPR